MRISIRLSLQVALIATCILIMVAVPLSYLFARKSFPGKRLLESLFMLPLVLPPTVVGYYLVVCSAAMGSSEDRSLALPAGHRCFPGGAHDCISGRSFPLLFQNWYHRHWRGRAEPGTCLLYASSVLKFETFRRVTIPLAKERALSGIALAFARAMGEFGATMMLAVDIPGRTNTMPLTIYNAFASGNDSEANLLVVITLLLLCWFCFTSPGRRARVPRVTRAFDG